MQMLLPKILLYRVVFSVKSIGDNWRENTGNVLFKVFWKYFWFSCENLSLSCVNYSKGIVFVFDPQLDTDTIKPTSVLQYTANCWSAFFNKKVGQCSGLEKKSGCLCDPKYDGHREVLLCLNYSYTYINYQKKPGSGKGAERPQVRKRSPFVRHSYTVQWPHGLLPCGHFCFFLLPQGIGTFCKEPMPAALPFSTPLPEIWKSGTSSNFWRLCDG